MRFDDVDDDDDDGGGCGGGEDDSVTLRFLPRLLSCVCDLSKHDTHEAMHRKRKFDILSVTEFAQHKEFTQTSSSELRVTVFFLVSKKRNI